MHRTAIYTAALTQATASQQLTEADTTSIWINKAVLLDKWRQLESAFTPSTCHAIAIKSNPLVGVLKLLVEAGSGLEAASMGEMALARAAGCPNERLVFDSPAKTVDEIQEVAAHFPGCYLNADNLAELDRIPINAPLHVGLRINMGKNVAGVDYLNVSERYAKFGASIEERASIKQAILSHPLVTGLHIHSGSQMDELPQSVANIAALVTLAQEINQLMPGKIKWIDIGGGLPVDYHRPDQDALPNYVALLKESCPSLFDGSFHVITEFGRWVHAQAGWTCTRVEHVKPTDRGGVAIVHAGADLFLRECYTPDSWYHGMQVLDRQFYPKQSDATRPYTIAGPLCFGGDIVDRDHELPPIDAGDHLIIEDTGANSFALWSRHCSRFFPKVLLYDEDLRSVTIIRGRETAADIVQFWGG